MRIVTAGVRIRIRIQSLLFSSMDFKMPNIFSFISVFNEKTDVTVSTVSTVINKKTGTNMILSILKATEEKSRIRTLKKIMIDSDLSNQNGIRSRQLVTRSNNEGKVPTGSY
jgi:hypothetical protein